MKFPHAGQKGGNVGRRFVRTQCRKGAWSRGKGGNAVYGWVGAGVREPVADAVLHVDRLPPQDERGGRGMEGSKEDSDDQTVPERRHVGGLGHAYH